jgi:hypothetical protein
MKKSEPQFDEVLRRMLSTPPTHQKPAPKKAKALPKKPATKKPA